MVFAFLLLPTRSARVIARSLLIRFDSP